MREAPLQEMSSVDGMSLGTVSVEVDGPSLGQVMTLEVHFRTW
jgi:hypothetical protein